MWVVKVSLDNQSKILKCYPFRLQCVIWCYLHGFVCHGFSDFGPYAENRVLVYQPCADAKLTIEEKPDERV